MTKENRDFVLLGIKYESAKIAGVSDAALERIAGQLREEVGEEWATDPMVVRGRDAVRREHGLDLDAPADDTGEKSSSPRSWLKIFGRRS